MSDRQIQTVEGRTVCFADYGDPSDTPVMFCHGRPGSRLLRPALVEAGIAAGFRLIGVDRPGYGKTTALPGRSICDWTRDALAVADHLALEKFYVEGISTGGSYSLATASVAPHRVQGVLVCCGMTDMSWAIEVEEARMTGPLAIWEAPDREAAIAVAVEQLGAKGDKMMRTNPDSTSPISPPDMAVLSSPEYGQHDPDNQPFAQGLIGFADDRIANGPANGWSSFDVTKVVCPVIVIHGEQDWIVPVAHAHHTTSILQDAELRTYPAHGHLSVISESVATLVDLRSVSG